ncbi:hypothetical protein SYNPS1DRAFT_26935 [Syncephalis pseudoplumigaleata]|uniref:Uncharacterized protein n=1 Tax=Syncephalis pseudoplumigaleata TaxID=1712513 RepID=A0A4P9Z4R1_9FUNG|nr:hypothetical protein SYNPS1DRAFT_26935 [Syncephalis pseudoplumigaleata]|eukprot:RKP27408.1 hypothetical protein SYNPS1DRAFT_26935 [Syncephalis pseudoplumigaleata]
MDTDEEGQRSSKRPRHSAEAAYAEAYAAATTTAHNEQSAPTNWLAVKKLSTHRLKPSMHYGVQWTAEQKEQLFRTVERYGIHDLSRFANRVDHKSTLECAGYLANVQRAIMELRHGNPAASPLWHGIDVLIGHAVYGQVWRRLARRI